MYLLFEGHAIPATMANQLTRSSDQEVSVQLTDSDIPGAFLSEPMASHTVPKLPIALFRVRSRPYQERLRRFALQYVRLYLAVTVLCANVEKTVCSCDELQLTVRCH